MTYIGIAILIGVVVLIGLQFRQKKNDGTESQETDRLSREIKNLQEQVESERSKKDEFAGKNKQMFVELTELKAEAKALSKERENLREEVTGYKAEEKRREKDFTEKIGKLETAKIALEDEKKRVIRQDEERIAHEKEERDRIWNDHENVVIAMMNEILMLPEYQTVFKGYSNTKLPEGFDGSLKPDFLVEFGDQYVIFDAKCSKSDDLNTYIRDAVKSTAKKVKSKADTIYRTIFFVVPTIALQTLKKTSFYEQGWTFHAIPPEALGPILAILKRMTEYESVQQMNPEERENIVNVLARHSQFINWKGAHDIIAAQMGSELLHDTATILPEISKEAEMKKKKLGILKPKPSDILKLASDSEAREDIVKNLVSPKATITKKTLREAVEVELFE